MRFLGIPLTFEPTYFALVVLGMMQGNSIAAYSGAPSAGQGLIAGFTVVCIITLSILLHERAHVYAANAYKINCREIRLFALGGVALLEEFPKTPGKYFMVAVAGPIASATLFFVLAHLYPHPLGSSYSLLYGLVAYAARINFVLATFNLLPISPLDGGRMLYATLWKFLNNAALARIYTRRVAKSIMIILLVILLTGMATRTISLFSFIWFLLIGYFLWQAQDAPLQ